jgi:single-stranded-DNA-specific exonuclease
LNSAQHLDRFNRERQELEQRTLDQALRVLEASPAEQTHSIVLAGENWHPGVIGIVASRLVERFHRPTVLISLDGEGGKGSARSIRGFHLFRELQACAQHLDTFGGHEMAAGLSLASGQVDAFAAAFEAQARQALTDDDLIPRLSYDGELTLAELTLAAVHEIEALSPCGMGNPEPQLVIEAVQPRRIQVVGERHIRFIAVQDGYSHSAIAFGMIDRLDELQEGPVDLLATPQINSYQGRETVQLRVRDFRTAAARDV